MSKLLEPGVHFEVPREVYNADPGINQSTLKKFMTAKSPRHFKHEIDNPPEVDKDYLRIGSAIDCLVSSPSSFDDLFKVAPAMYPVDKPTAKDPRTEKPWTLKSKWCEDWWNRCIELNYTPLTEAERKRVRGMVDGLERHDDIAKWINSCHRQVCVIAIHPTLGYRMKGLLDLLPDIHSRWIFDLKSDGMGADPATFHKHHWKMWYAFQAAWYMEICRYAGMDTYSFGWFVVESDPPHEAAIHYLEEGDMEITKARERYTAALPQYVAYRDANNWPGYSRDWIKVKYKDWQLNQTPEEYERLT